MSKTLKIKEQFLKIARGTWRAGMLARGVTMNVADENSTESTRLTVHSIESTST